MGWYNEGVSYPDFDVLLDIEHVIFIVFVVVVNRERLLQSWRLMTACLCHRDGLLGREPDLPLGHSDGRVDALRCGGRRRRVVVDGERRCGEGRGGLCGVVGPALEDGRKATHDRVRQQRSQTATKYRVYT